MTDRSSSSFGAESPRPLNAQGRLILGLIGIAVALRALSLGAGPASRELDPSWTAVLGWAAAQSAQFGRDLVFTYGPLGFLHPNAAYVPEVYSAFLVGQVLLALWLGASAFILLARMRLQQRFGYCAAALVCAPWITADVAWLLALAQNAVLLCLPYLGRAQPGPSRLASSAIHTAIALILGFGAAALALLKFSMLPVALILVTATSLALNLLGARRLAIAHAAAFAVGLLLIWLGTGQAPGGFASFLSRSLEIASGYGNAMGLMPHPLVDVLGFSSMALSGGWLGWQVLAQRRAPARAILLFALGCVAYVAWRQGFTRADGHIHQTFSLLVLLPLLGLSVCPNLGRAARWMGVFASLAALTVGLLLARDQLATSKWTEVFTRMPNVMAAYSDVDTQIAQREALAEQLRATYPLPGIRDRVGTASVDVISWEQGLAILHRMNYQPRPVFQSYSAYTPALMRLNEAHFLKPDGPRFVLLKIQAIDHRLPSGEDALALSALLRAYAPVLEESGFLLMERSTEAAVEPQPQPEWQMTAALGEWVEVPARQGPKFVALRANASFLGRLYGFWFRTPPLQIEVETLTGVRSRYRLQPRAAEAGFLLSPLLRDTNQLLGLYLGHQPESVRRFRIVSPNSEHSRMWSGSVEIGFGSFRWQQPSEAQRANLVPDTARAGFRLRELAREGLVQRIEEQGRDVLFMHSPASIEVQISPGTHRVRAEFGIREEAVASEGCAAAGADGIRLLVELKPGGQDWREIRSIDINPWTIAEHRGAQALSVDVDASSHARLRLRMQPGPPGSQTACDWAWVHGLKLEPR